jgi:hypothetical protein
MWEEGKKDRRTEGKKDGRKVGKKESRKDGISKERNTQDKGGKGGRGDRIKHAAPQIYAFPKTQVPPLN